METKKLKDLSFEALCGIIAKVVHSANRAYVDAIGGRAVNLSWEEIREEERSGLIKAVAGMITNPQLPETSHEQWCLAREKDGWTKDIKYDYNRKTHPNLVPYDQLPIEEQFKDQLFMGLASIFCGGLGILDMPEVQAARRILAARYENNPLPDEIDPDEGRDPAPDEKPVGIEDGVGFGKMEELVNGAEVAEAVMTGGPPEEIEIKDTAEKSTEVADDTTSTDGPVKQEDPVETSDVQESTANGAGKSEPEGKASVEDGEKVETAKPKAKKPAKKSSGK